MTDLEVDRCSRSAIKFRTDICWAMAKYAPNWQIDGAAVLQGGNADVLGNDTFFPC